MLASVQHSSGYDALLLFVLAFIVTCVIVGLDALCGWCCARLGRGRREARVNGNGPLLGV